jgi:hypothetical protein
MHALRSLQTAHSQPLSRPACGCDRRSQNSPHAHLCHHVRRAPHAWRLVLWPAYALRRRLRLPNPRTLTPQQLTPLPPSSPPSNPPGHKYYRNPPVLGSGGSRPQVQPAGALRAQARQRPEQQPDRRCRGAGRLRARRLRLRRPAAVPVRACCLRARICCVRGRLLCDGGRIVGRVPGGTSGLRHTPAGPDVCLCLHNARNARSDNARSVCVQRHTQRALVITHTSS